MFQTTGQTSGAQDSQIVMTQTDTSGALPQTWSYSTPQTMSPQVQ